MTLRNVLLPLLLLGTAVAEEPAPILLWKNAAIICHRKGNDAPDCVTGPRAKYAPDPSYPEDERHARHEGTVVLDVIVGSDGLPRDVEVSRTLSPEFDQAAILAVKNWRFTPATRDGKPIAVGIHVQVAFRLRW